MTVTEQAFDIPPATLFAIIVDPASYPEWLIGTEKICEVSADWPAPGSFFEHKVGFGPIVIPDRSTARDIESPLMFELLVRARR